MIGHRQQRLIDGLRPGLDWLLGLGRRDGTRRSPDRARWAPRSTSTELTERLVAAIEAGGGRVADGHGARVAGADGDGRDAGFAVTVRERRW